MKWIIDCRLRVTEEEKGELALPRIIRLCRKFKFTDNESRIAIFSLVAQSGYDRENRFGYGGADVISTCQFLEIPLQDMLDFLDPDRSHMQQGFFPEVQPSYIFSCTVNYDPDYCKALMGSQLRSSEFLKLEQTLLADVIAEEPGNEHYRDENLGLKVVSPTNLPVVPPGEGGEEGGAGEPMTMAEVRVEHTILCMWYLLMYYNVHDLYYVFTTKFLLYSLHRKRLHWVSGNVHKCAHKDISRSQLPSHRQPMHTAIHVDVGSDSSTCSAHRS